MINWRPISELPDELKDGRQVLLWSYGGADVGTWTTGPNDWDKPETGYFEALYECVPCEEPTHFAELLGPNGLPHNDCARETDTIMSADLSALTQPITWGKPLS